MTSRKTQLDNLYALVWALAAGSAAFSLSCLALVSHFRSFTPLLSSLGSSTCPSSLLACPGTPTALLSYFMPAPVLGSPDVLLFLPVLRLALPHLASTTLKTFKQALSDKFLRHCSTSLVEFFCLFPLFDSLHDKTNRKQTFDIAFINSCLVASNHV